MLKPEHTAPGTPVAGYRWSNIDTSSQYAYKSLLAKIKTICKHCDGLTNKVANLEAVGTTLTKAHKKKSSIFDMPKKDASTSLH